MRPCDGHIAIYCSNKLPFSIRAMFHLCQLTASTARMSLTQATAIHTVKLPDQAV